VSGRDGPDVWIRGLVLEPMLGPKTDRLDTGHPERNTRNSPPHDPSYLVVLVILVSRPRSLTLTLRPRIPKTP
jgi:hypothetical protein